MANTNTYLVSVADAIVRDPIADLVIFKGTSLIQTAFNQTMSAQEVRSGFGNGLSFVYNHSKKLDVSVESATFDETFIVLNNGSSASITNGLQNYYTFDEVVTLTAGSGTVAGTPVGNLYVQPLNGGQIQTIVPTGSNFTVSAGGNNKYKVSYRTAQTVDRITIDAGSTPNAFELTLRAKIFQPSGQTAELLITVPQWKIQGNFSLNMTAAGVSSSKLDGMALTNPVDNAIAYVDIKPIGTTAISYQAIAATPSSPTITVASPNVQISTYGIRGGAYANVLFNASTDLTYVSGTTATCTVSSSGQIARIAAGSSLITVTHTASGLKDYINVTAT